MATVRKSTSAMQPADWDRLIDAINKLHGTGVARPAYRDFVKIHARAMTNAQAMATWRVHTMPDMGVRGTISWSGIASFSSALNSGCSKSMLRSSSRTGIGSLIQPRRRRSATRRC
jgi:hypothetical protein